MSNIFGNYSAWLHTLPPWSQPAIATFIPCFTVIALLAIRHRVNLYRQGKPFIKTKAHPATLIGGLLLAAVMVYCREHYPAAKQILDWPHRAFPYYHRHGLMMWLGFGAATYAASGVSALFASLFLRGGGGHSSRGGIIAAPSPSIHMLPEPPDGYGYFRWPEQRRRIIGTRTRITTYKE